MESSTRPRRPDAGEVLDVTVDRLAYGGNGVARHGGYVLFVPGTVPGDRARVQVTKRKKGYGEAKVVGLLAPSSERIPPRADHPGAAWQVLPYPRQLEIKAEQVDDALRRIGHLDGFELEPIVPADEQWGYRNKLEYSFGTGPTGELVCGFHAPGSWAREQELEPYDRRTQTGFLRNLVLREARRTGQLQVRVVTSPGELDTDSLAAAVEATSVVWTVIEGPGETTAGGRSELVSGSSPTIIEELSGLEFAISSEAFFQTNTEMAERLYAVAVEYADLRGWERVYDLYCGAGTIALVLAARAGEVWGLELVEPAIADAIANARRNNVLNAHFFAGDVRLALRDLVERAGRPDVLVVDPPRAGLSQKVVRRVVEAAPRRIVYVSCNPTTLAPNAAQLVEAGYVLRKVRPVDMFPQTPHIECVALLEAGPDGVRNPERED
jgi:23S rRNA (uracil1939-C5)-methyltransferase